MAFQTPFEIAQSQLSRLRISSVEAREAMGAIFPFVDTSGATRFLVIDTLDADRPGGGLWLVEEFPLEIRHKKAIYPRPILHYRPLSELEPEALAGVYHFDAEGALASKPCLPPELAEALSSGNVALLARGREMVKDIFFTLDLRRLSGGVSRSGLFLRRRLELAALRGFLGDSQRLPGVNRKADVQQG